MRSGAGLHSQASPLTGPRLRVDAARLALLAALIFLCVTSGTHSRGAGAQSPEAEGPERARVLAPGVPFAGDLGGTDSHLFKLDAGRGRYVRVLLDKKDFHLSATLLSADGQVLSEYVSRRYGVMS
jgi:hypothetical protein